MIEEISVYGFGSFKAEKRIRFSPGLNVVYSKTSSERNVILAYANALHGSVEHCDLQEIPKVGGAYFKIKSKTGNSLAECRQLRSGTSFWRHGKRQSYLCIFEPLMSEFMSAEIISKFVENNPKMGKFRQDVLIIANASVNKADRHALASLAKRKNAQVIITSRDASWQNTTDVNFIGL